VFQSVAPYEPGFTVASHSHPAKITGGSRGRVADHFQKALRLSWGHSMTLWSLPPVARSFPSGLKSRAPNSGFRARAKWDFSVSEAGPKAHGYDLNSSWRSLLHLRKTLGPRP